MLDFCEILYIISGKIDTSSETIIDASPEIEELEKSGIVHRVS